MDEISKLKVENEKLKKINADKANLVSISAHQLRTSLSALKWILKMLIDKDLGKLTVEQEGFIKKAFDSNEHMITLVNNLLTLNHTGEMNMEPKLEKINLLKIIEQILFEFSGETFNKGIELTLLKPEDGLPEINCDTEMMRVVIQNLVENAIKYSQPHGKIVMSLRHKKESNEIEISIHDNGIGISKENQGNIFNKFFRATNAIKKESIGSGLGLFTAKNIVEHHKGKIWFSSEGGSASGGESPGTTFFVTLPIN
ncbi:MAG: HAMP domain-containing sensor histidine kinase [Patescibacteria group bacterium]